MTNPEIIKTVFLRVSPKVAWGYLTKADKLALWFHAPKEDLKDDQPYVLWGAESGEKICWGTVKKMQPYTLLTYTFSVKPFPSIETEVEWILDEVEGGTRITMRHTGMMHAGTAGFEMLTSVDGGWDGHFAKMRAIEV